MDYITGLIVLGVFAAMSRMSDARTMNMLIAAVTAVLIALVLMLPEIIRAMNGH